MVVSLAEQPGDERPTGEAVEPADHRPVTRLPRRGYRAPAKTYRLRFDDPDMEGLEVVARSVPVRTFVGLMALASSDDPSASSIEEIGKLFDAFGGALLDWNLTDEHGDPIPATREAVGNQDVDFMLRVALAWMAAIGDAPAPLGAGSTGGRRSVELSLPMVPSSESPPN